MVKHKNRHRVHGKIKILSHYRHEIGCSSCMLILQNHSCLCLLMILFISSWHSLKSIAFMQFPKGLQYKAIFNKHNRTKNVIYITDSLSLSVRLYVCMSLCLFVCLYIFLFRFASHSLSPLFILSVSFALSLSIYIYISNPSTALNEHCHLQLLPKPVASPVGLVLPLYNGPLICL